MLDHVEITVLTILPEVADEVTLRLKLSVQFMWHVGTLLGGVGVDHLHGDGSAGTLLD